MLAVRRRTCRRGCCRLVRCRGCSTGPPARGTGRVTAVTLTRGPGLERRGPALRRGAAACAERRPACDERQRSRRGRPRASGACSSSIVRETSAGTRDAGEQRAADHDGERARHRPGRRLGEQGLPASRGRRARAASQRPPRATSRPPATRPAAAPGAVSPRHQMPSTSSGQNVEAATAKARPTTWPTGRPAAGSARASGTDPASTAPRRKSRTVPSPPPRPPAARPGRAPRRSRRAGRTEVDRKAANAPATRSASSSWPPRPPTSAPGSARTTASVVAGEQQLGAYSRPSAPYSAGSR